MNENSFQVHSNVMLTAQMSSFIYFKNFSWEKTRERIQSWKKIQSNNGDIKSKLDFCLRLASDHSSFCKNNPKIFLVGYGKEVFQ